MAAAAGQRRAGAMAGHLAGGGGVGRGALRAAVLGASGGIGQPLGLLLAARPDLLGSLHLYDVRGTRGVGADLGHLDAGVPVRAFEGAAELGACLEGCDLVVIPAGVPRRPGMSRDDLFATNAGIVAELARACARHCPRALVAVISNPVNSTVPVAAAAMRKEGRFDPRRLFGVTTLDCVRASQFVAQHLGLDPRDVRVPVIGGHAGQTILPLLSQATPALALSPPERARLTQRIQNGGTEVVEAKAGAGSATLSMAYAAARFAESCLRALRGEGGVVECAYVASEVTELEFFASPVCLGREGVEAFLPLGPLDEAEREGLAKAKELLAQSIAKGLAFAPKPRPAPGAPAPAA